MDEKGMMVRRGNPLYSQNAYTRSFRMFKQWAVLVRYAQWRIASSPISGRMAALKRFVEPICFVFLAVLTALAPISSIGDSGAVLEVGKFSAAKEGQAFPDGWKPLTFKKIERHTKYELVRDGDRVVVKATSEAGSAGLTREIRIDPKEYSIISWRWKVTNVYQKGDVTKKEGDDYPARLYITFEYDSSRVGFLEKAQYEAVRLLYGQYPPLGALSYIWESKAPKGTIVPNPYTDKVKMIVVESGTERLNQWIDEERNLYEDYKKAFGEEPPMISGVAIMTDSDNTLESATAYYGDIVFRKAAL
ncbi:DUF3047 domain-containing protein [Nitrospira calida]|jgi:hypothetical protein